jgi:hypothetical protein
MNDLIHTINSILIDNTRAFSLLPYYEDYNSKDYDDYYFTKLKYTKSILEKCLVDEEGIYLYRAYI